MKFQDLESNPGYQLWLASNAWQRVLRKALEGVGLTHVQFVLLASIALLSQERECVTQAEVARFADVDENMTSQVVRALVDHGYVERHGHPTDQRARSLRLTTQGERAVAKAKERVAPARDAFFAPLGDHARDLAHLLRKVVESQESRGGGPS